MKLRLSRVLAAAIAISVSATPAFAGTRLWAEFESGMTPEQVVASALKVPGVRSAKIKQATDGTSVVVGHGMYSATEVAGKKSRLSFEFQNGRLYSVSIKPEPWEVARLGKVCLSDAINAFKYYDLLLGRKYERNAEPDPALDSINVQGLSAEATLAQLSKDRQYQLPVRTVSAGYTDGMVQIINTARLHLSSEPMCQGIAGSNVLTYFDKSEYERTLLETAARKSAETEAKIKALSDGL